MKYTLNLRPNYSVETIIDISQYDTELRVIDIDLYYGNQPYEIPEDAVITARGTKADNTVFEDVLPWEGNTTTWSISGQISLFPGLVPCQLRVTKDGEIIGTAAFRLKIQESPFDAENAVLSESQLPLLETAEQNAIRAEQAKNQAENAADRAEQALADITVEVERTEDGVIVRASDLTGETEAEVYDGYSPEASVRDNGDGTYTLTVTDKDGTTTVTFRAGTDGDSLEATAEPVSGGTKVTIKNARTHVIETEFTVLNGIKGDTGERGPKGETGDDGNGILSIAKTSSSGLIDVYTISYTDGTSTNFEVTNGEKGDTGDTGNGIASTILNADYTLTITYTDGTTYTTSSIRGAKGEQGIQGIKGDTGNGIVSIIKTATSGLVDTYTITYSDGTTSTYTVTNGADGDDYVITQSDYTAIADIVYAMLVDANGQSF